MGGPLRWRSAWSTEQTPGHPGRHGEALSQKTKQSTAKQNKSHYVDDVGDGVGLRVKIDSFPPAWVLGIELDSSGLIAINWTHGTILLALIR